MKKEHHLFDELLFCGECNHRLSITPRRNNNTCYTLCNYYRTHRNACSPHCNNYDKLEKVLTNVIKNELNKLVDRDKIKNYLKKNEINNDIENILSIDDNRNLIIKIINKIEIYKDKNILIYFNFSEIQNN